MICVQGSLFNSALPFSSNVSEEKKHIWTTSDLSSLKGKNPKAASTAGLCYKAGQLTGKSCLAQRTWESCAGRNALCCLPGGNWPGERSSGSPAALVRLTEVNRSHSPLVLYTAPASPPTGGVSYSQIRGVWIGLTVHFIGDSNSFQS